jgi:hypothetical protein
MLVVYYSVLIAWVINAFFDAFGDEAPWADESLVMSPLPTFWKKSSVQALLARAKLPA